MRLSVMTRDKNGKECMYGQLSLAGHFTSGTQEIESGHTGKATMMLIGDLFASIAEVERGEDEKLERT